MFQMEVFTVESDYKVREVGDIGLFIAIVFKVL